MPTPLEKFQTLLRELFQFEQADLDFGVYRIMNLRRERMERWLNDELPARAREILKQGGNTADDDLGKHLDVLKADLLAADPGGVDADGIITNEVLKQLPKGREYLKLKAQVDRAPARTVAGMEPLVYNHLYDFFSRYYDTGDFIPKRRRSFAPDGRDTYAIPWDGEEVVLHWANKDQYYIKTGERFTHYRWQSAAGGRTFTIEFRLTDADLPANNNKDAKKKFNLLVADKVEWQEDKATLILPFHYRGLTPEEEAQLIGTQEAKLRESIIKRTVDSLRELPAVSGVPQLVTALMAPKRDAGGQEKRDKDGNAVPLLPHHLNRWAVKNESDFFIHKDLRRFLSGELDYFLKSVVLNLDNLLAAGEQRAEPNFRLLDAVKRLGTEIVDFVSQLEDFQKALFEKKKFVLETSWCLTLDRIPASVKEEVYATILANDRQWEEWEKLYALSTLSREGDLSSNEEGQSFVLQETPAGTMERPGMQAARASAKATKQRKQVVYKVEDSKEDFPKGFVPSCEFLDAHPYLMLDTALGYSPALVEKLLGCIENLAEKIDGLLIHSENLQALTLLQERYREAVKCTYIDPPYNTGEGDFIYKDSFQHSSWLALATERIAAGRHFLAKDGFLSASIDDVELNHLLEMLRLTFGENHVATLVWDRNRKNDAKLFSVGHEYMVVVARDVGFLKERGVELREPRDGLDDAKKVIAKLRKVHGEDWDAIRSGWLAWFDQILVSDPRRRMMRYSKVGSRGPYRDDGNINWPGGGGPRYEILHPKTKMPVKVPASGWRYPSTDRFWEEYASGKIVFGRDETTVPSTMSYLFESDGQVMPSVHYSYAQTASLEFKALMGDIQFDNPKNWRDIARITRYLAGKNDLILDYFGGSGTTGHAAIAQNREDGGKRKYVLVEMGAHFDKVMKPRIQKVVFSESWKDGVPVRLAIPKDPNNPYNGISHCIKVLRLESYEDALDNIEFNTAAAPGVELGLDFSRDYELRYALDWESKECPTRLAVEQLDTPFDYTLTLRRETGTVTVKPDLPETFAYLIGLHTRRRFRTEREGVSYLIYTGTLHADGTEVAVLWRTCRGWKEANLKAEMDWWREQRETLAPGSTRVYVNGASAIAGHYSLDAEFKNRMHGANA